MKAGRELDALIAKKVMEHPPESERIELVNGVGQSVGEMFVPGECPKYSTDIASAWSIVEKLKLTVWPTEDGRWFVFQNEFGTAYGDEYWFGGSDFKERLKDPSTEWVIADTAPLAICLSALKVCGYGIPS